MAINHSTPSPLQKSRFYKKLIFSILSAIGFLIISLGAGMWGYRYFEGMNWVDSFANASMILAGMGPLDPLHTEHGKIFAGFYALYSGIAFLVAIAVMLAPILHRFFHKIHLETLTKE